MLKRLELVGFKSFADKTRLDFEPGISGIVGPNGSGKSNIVDAIRWILGEQSAKSLRGKEMADVIFNGSGTRRSLGMAEVSLYLDNTKQYLPINTEEVVLSRRVYRSGESEYFINGQLARLRDIRDLFLGTGAGHHAYSIIEQGKVDQILQSSAKDRRFIFEEAAGISRFKARKIDALRRLERVAQNLVRVQDIKDEVDKQLRSLRQQASKARRYKELSERYKLLRLQHGSEEYRQLTGQLDELAKIISPLETSLARARHMIEQDEPRQKELEIQVAEHESIIRQFSDKIASVRESISALESEIANDAVRDAELTEEVQGSYRQLARGRQNLVLLERDLASTRERYQSAVAERQSHLDSMEESKLAFERLSGELDMLRRTSDDLQARARERFQDLTRYENEQSAFDGQLSFLWQQRDRLANQQSELTATLDALRREEFRLIEQEIAIRTQMGNFISQSSAMESIHRECLERRTALQEKIATERQEKIAAESRIDVLDQLRRRHEGLDAGVRKVLAERTEGDTLWSVVLGVLAEQIEVEADLADIIELALGPRAQSLVVQSLADLTDELLNRARSLPGRVHFLAIEDPFSDRLIVSEEELDWPTLAHLVKCQSTLRPLIDRLLGQTYLADDFERARDAARRSYDLRFVTRSGDILEPDGSVGTGKPNKTIGILARSAEIRALREQAEQCAARILELESEFALIDIDVRRIEAQLNEQEVRRSTLSEQSRHVDLLLRQNHDRVQTVESQLATNRREHQRAIDDVRDANAQYAIVEEKLAATHEIIRLTNEELRSANDAIDARATEYNQLSGRINESRTLLAVADERIGSLRSEEQKLNSEVDARQLEVDALAGRVRLAESRRRDTLLRQLFNRAQLADLYSAKDALHGELGDAPAELEHLREERRRISDELGRLRQTISENQETIHRSQLRSTELRMRRDTLLARVAEDYGVDLADYQVNDEEKIQLDEASVAKEIDELRDKLARLGSVNSEAVAELDDLEKRSATFELQINDLNVAQKHLETLIGKINEECRRLFVDTFETIRTHFQELFRKLFGGGKADIVLEDENDVLESGLEIVARPPGKEPQSISLLSGGEKTMTAVALVMAIFRSKPSPFCILDEVDAALDEANIGRFMQMVREYTNLSQFIIITHSKTTMANADVLHGITQRESGVSIRVSVRLEDVTEDGHIIDREENDTSAA